MVSVLAFFFAHLLPKRRNLFYTGLTRASKLAIVIGQKKVISIAVNQWQKKERYTRLKERLIV